MCKLLFFVLLTCMNISVTPTTYSLVNSDHVSEGVIFTKEDGSIFHIYRHATGVSGDHTDNNARLYRRDSNDFGATWSTPTVFYNSVYDDRNPCGGTTADGRHVLFFWKHDYSAPAIVDTMVMYSDDDGDTWTTPTSITGASALTDPLPFGPMIDIYDNPDPTKRYMMGFVDEATSYRLEVLFSEDGSTWGDAVMVKDYTSGHAYNINEASYTYIGGGKIICISRDQLYSVSGSNYYQLTSSDYGATWGTPVKTNFASPHFTPAPLTILHNGMLLIIGADRRSLSSTGAIADEGMWIYSGQPNIVFGSPTAYKPELFIPRPVPTSDDAFYGYKAFAKITDHQYLLVVTDRREDASNEDANFYQYYVNIENDTPIIGTTYNLPVFNNGTF